ncbi:two-component system response regulator [Clostridia bacterium]|nr:two-component system response regulator [Clostridia bacterium]
MINRKETILVVDDQLSVLDQINSMLESDYDVLLAKNGHTAIQICKSKHPDLVLLDIDMPGMDGFAAFKILQANQLTSDIPVVFLTASRDSKTESRCFESGARDFLTKPTRRETLLHRIRLHLAHATYQRKLEQKVSDLSYGLSLSLADMIESRDENTGNHVVRVSSYTRLLGRALIGHSLYKNVLSEGTLESACRASPLHDIGKIMIPDSVLLKPGKLSDEEFTIIKAHPELGQRILGEMYTRTPSIQHLYFARDIAGTHHERWDGRGYPHGLAGDDIPVWGRLTAIADVYDALVDNRVYRKGMCHEEAANIIIQGRGTQFDPVMTDTFETINKQFYEEFLKLSNKA